MANSLIRLGYDHYVSNEDFCKMLEEERKRGIDLAITIGGAEERSKIMTWLASNDDITLGDAIHALVKDKARRMNW